MADDTKTWRTLDRVARVLNRKRTRRVVSKARRAISGQVKTVGNKVVDKIVSRLSQTPIGDERPTYTPPPYTPPPPKAKPPAPEPEIPEAIEVPEALEAPEAPEVMATEKDRPMPARFGIDRVVLLIRHADRGFAYWETDPARLEEHGECVAELRLVDEHGECVAAAKVSPDRGRRNLDIPAPGRPYTAELVLLTESDEIVLSRSAEATAPDAKPRAEI